MKLKIWIDVLTPKQALFFAPLYDWLTRNNHDVLLTTRVYREAVQSLQLKKLPFHVVGKHGGADPYAKLVSSAQRIMSLARLIQKWRPDVAVSFSSVEASRVAFGLSVPHVAVNDSPHSRFVARLTIPLSRYVCSPWIIPSHIWKSFGARRDDIVAYKALDPAAWLKRHKPNSRVVKELRLTRTNPIVLLRTEEAFASYLAGKASDKAPVIGPVIREILRLGLKVQIIVSTRYGQQAPVLRKMFGRRVRVIDRVVDAASLLDYSTIFIGSGGTMTIEAALLGKPAISCFPGEKPLYIKYLEQKGLVKSLKDPKKIALEVKRILSSPDFLKEQRERGRALLAWMEDPIVRISKVVIAAAND
ncbi:MAG TPA: DUF354 domain-containing protein [Candidatus Bathyarchaeia archaeon]|nr:DUF354 domain-containing protein [Candidatus Bathyarchaeia archaeon]